ncbi:MAG: oxygenase MpaB family protein [Thiohalocapsa sp.]
MTVCDIDLATPDNDLAPPALLARIPVEVINPPTRWARARYIAGLDPKSDCQEIGFLLGCCEFPWDTTRALELALLRTFGIAKGTPLLTSTGELTLRTQKRYDDTALILAEILENGYDHPRGRAALRRMNQQHHGYRIPNDEYIYTLSTFVLEPIRWNARFGWRTLTRNERHAGYYLWREIGLRMGIRDIPDSYEALEDYSIAFEREHYRYTEDNHQLALATRNLMLGWLLPRPFWPLGAAAIHAMLDEPMLTAVGLPSPPRILRRLSNGVMRMRARALRHLPPNKRPRLVTRLPSRTYPDGYRIDQLGADRGQ